MAAASTSREKGYLRRDDRSELVITSEGIDYVESKTPNNRIVRRLLRSPDVDAEGNAR